MKISVLIITHNRLEFLKQCLESVRVQYYGDREIIVLDNGSTDGTREYLASQTDLKVFVFDKNKHSAERYNFILQRATGDIVFFLSDDDMIHNPNVFSNVINRFKVNPYMEVFMGSAELINSSGQNIGRDYIADPVHVCKIWSKDYVHFGTMFFKKSVFSKIGEFNNELIFNLDYDMKIRCFMECQCCAENIMIVKYRVHSGQDSTGFKSEERHIESRKMRDKLNIKYGAIFV